MDKNTGLLKKREKIRVMISVDKELWLLFKNYAEQRELSLSQAVQRIMKEEMRKSEEFSNAMKNLGIFV